jgi:protein subunit release factor B
MTVRPDKVQALRERMAALYILEKDLKEQFVLSGGRGGQKLQKTRSCVILKHLPSGLVIRCERERSRETNRYLARRMLCEQLERRQHHPLRLPDLNRTAGGLDGSGPAVPSEIS